MRIIKVFLGLVLLVVLAAGGLLGYLSLTEYRPDDIEPLEVVQAARKDNVRVGERLDVLSFNTGYCGLGREQDFFMDGGSMVRPRSEEDVRANLNGILSELVRQNVDIYLLQEVDFDSWRSYNTNQADTYRHGLSLNMACAYNFKCEFVPYPWQGRKRPGHLHGPQRDRGHPRKPARALQLAGQHGQPQALPAD